MESTKVTIDLDEDEIETISCAFDQLPKISDSVWEKYESLKLMQGSIHARRRKVLLDKINKLKKEKNESIQND
jgi:hypothetical protein